MESLLASCPSMQELMEQVCLESKWYSIGVLLGLDPEKLNSIRQTSVNEWIKTSDMYQLWRESKQLQATRGKLIKVLESLDLNKQATEYKKYLEQSIKNITPRPERTRKKRYPCLYSQKTYKSIILSHPCIIVAIIFLAIFEFIIISIIIATIIIINLGVFSPPPDSHTSIPQVIEQYGSQLRIKYNETLTKYDDKYPTASPASVRVPFIPLISIVVKNATNSTAEWLLSTTPNDIIQNELKIQTEDILKPVSHKHLKFVLIEGEPGIGKSTLAKELVLRWANRSDKLLNNYDIVFLIQLRFKTYHKATSIKDLFVNLDNESIINMTELKLDLKKKKGADILWILDGFDELPSHLKNSSVLMKLIKGKVHSKSTVIVTSRPVAIDHLLDILHNEPNSKRISLRGFDSTKIEEYASKYYKNKEILAKFHSYYNGNLVIESMLYNPLHCFIVCTIFNNLATNNEQYPKTMTSLYNHYVRILLKRHLNGTGLISDPDHYNMPQNLMLETDFNDLLLQNVWKNFSLLLKIAYDGVMKQQYIFGKEIHNVTKLSMINTIPYYEKNESSSFLHTTLQDYFAALYFVNSNKLNFTTTNPELQKNLKVVFTFYVGICKMVNKTLDSTVLDILKQNMTVSTGDKYQYAEIGNIMLGCLYEDDSLIYNIGLPVNHLYIECSTNFDYYIYGYLVAVHNITFKTQFYNSDQIKALNKGLQSHSTVSGKLAIGFLIKNNDERQKGFKELLLMPSQLLIEIKISPSNKSEIAEICCIIFRFQLLQTVAFYTPSLQWSCTMDPCDATSSENPLLKLKNLSKLEIVIDHAHRDSSLKLLKHLIVSVNKPLKTLHLTNHGTPYDKVLNLIDKKTSLEELMIVNSVDTHRHGTETYTPVIPCAVFDPEPELPQKIIWTKSTNNLRVDYYETFFYYTQIRTLPTMQLSSFTSFTYIKTNETKNEDRWILLHVILYSESTTFELNHFIDDFRECIIKIKNSINKTIKIKNFTCAIVKQEKLLQHYDGGLCHDTKFYSVKAVINNILFLLIFTILKHVNIHVDMCIDFVLMCCFLLALLSLVDIYACYHSVLTLLIQLLLLLKLLLPYIQLLFLVVFSLFILFCICCFCLIFYCL